MARIWEDAKLESTRPKIDVVSHLDQDFQVGVAEATLAVAAAVVVELRLDRLVLREVGAECAARREVSSPNSSFSQ